MATIIIYSYVVAYFTRSAGHLLALLFSGRQQQQVISFISRFDVYVVCKRH